MKPDKKQLGIGVLAVLAALLVGYLPQRSVVTEVRESLRATEARVAQLEQELAATRLSSRLGAALSEAQRGNFERARQLTSSFYTDLGAVRATRPESVSATLGEIESQRDDIITMLSRAVPESIQRLALITTSYYAAIDPTASSDPSLTPTPPPTTNRD